MINKEKLAEVQTLVRGNMYEELTLDNMSQQDMLSLRDMLNDRLPNENVGELSLEAELVEQYRKTKRLYNEIHNDKEVQANQKAQVANSVRATLEQMVRMQEDLRKGEVLKLMETVLIDAIKTLPQDVKDRFFEEYERRAKRAGLA